MSGRRRRLESWAAFATGLVFGAGLLVSGMANPRKVLGFLDVTGMWDPSLALVMAAAVAVGFAGFLVIGRRTESELGLPMRLPSSRTIDRRLVAGAIVFGMGWGLAGFCPGPALVALGSGFAKALLFSASMVAGMALFEVASRIRRRDDATPGPP